MLPTCAQVELPSLDRMEQNEVMRSHGSTLFGRLEV